MKSVLKGKKKSELLSDSGTRTLVRVLPDA